MADRRYVDFQNTLNRTLNKSVSIDRLRIQAISATAPTVAIGYIASGAHTISSIHLRNDYYLTVLMDVSLTVSGVTTVATSISYRRSPEMRSDDWIFRYEYERAVSEEYPYPTAHLHV